MKKKFKLDIVIKGKKSDFLSIKFLDEDSNEFEKVLYQFEDSKDFGSIIDNIVDKILLMADKIGVRKDYFKVEGPYNVHRFRGTGKEFRLLCLPYGTFNVIIGGCALKALDTDTYQENPEYYHQIKILRAIDKALVENEVDFTKLTDYIEQIFEMEI